MLANSRGKNENGLGTMKRKVARRKARCWLIVVSVSVAAVTRFLSSIANNMIEDASYQSEVVQQQQQEFHICRQDFLPVPMPDGSMSRHEIDYQCQGRDYEAFGTDLLEFIQNKSFFRPSWGRRSLPLPDHTSVLFLGNSHTRQTFHEYACQFSNHIVSKTAYYEDRAFSFGFDNNSTMVLLYNSPVEISVKWEQRLESIVHRKIQSFDAVVLGQFNGASKDITNTTYYKEMMHLSKAGGDPDLQFGKVEPPGILQISQVYQGPIVFVSGYGFGKSKGRPALQIVKVIEEIKEQKHRNNLRSILSRKYIPELNGLECATDKHYNGTCAQQPGSHRCVGTWGGHPTLVAFDLQEALFELMK